MLDYNQAIEALQAAKNGEDVELYDSEDSTWDEVPNPSFSDPIGNYRKKQEVEYEDLTQKDMIGFNWIRYQDSFKWLRIVEIEKFGIKFFDEHEPGNVRYKLYENLRRDYYSMSTDGDAWKLCRKAKK